ncbi:MAG: holo-ACP synthase [Candidatus Omnitrophica bacterium]|nr:holo-ACP synthase [Candidatus Omnitrophota bacterium]
MGPLSLGCDLCRIGEMDRMLKEDPASTQRLFHPEEWEYAFSRTRPEQHLAGFFAAKEALAKAIRESTLLGKYRQEVIVRHREDGAPYLVLSDSLSETFSNLGMKILDLSVSHDGDYAMAAVIVRTQPLQCAKCLLSIDHLRTQRVAEWLMPVETREGTRFLCPPCLRGW